MAVPDETVEDHKDEEIVATKPEAKGRLCVLELIG